MRRTQKADHFQWHKTHFPIFLPIWTIRCVFLSRFQFFVGITIFLCQWVWHTAETHDPMRQLLHLQLCFALANIFIIYFSILFGTAKIFAKWFCSEFGRISKIVFNFWFMFSFIDKYWSICDMTIEIDDSKRWLKAKIEWCCPRFAMHVISLAKRRILHSQTDIRLN